MKIYTQTGDQGKTSLLSGERVLKSHMRVRAYGEIDELNAIVGMLVTSLQGREITLAGQLEQLQSDLFHAGAWLATTEGNDLQGQVRPITRKHCEDMEAQIDKISDQLPELKAFILPGGDAAAGWSHVARTVCRRAERSVVELLQGDAGADEALQPIAAFLNRLSDYFFVLARYLNHVAGVADKIWRP